MVFVLLALVAITIPLAIGALQLPVSKNYMKNEVITAFNNQFEGSLEVEDVGGFLPFSASVENGKIYSPSDSTLAVFSFDKAEVRVNMWELLQQNLSISSFEVSEPTFHLKENENGEITFFNALKQRELPEQQQPDILEGEIRILERIHIYAPEIKVLDGRIVVDRSVRLPEQLHLNPPFNVENVDLEVFLEVTESQIFFDLPNFYADIPGTSYRFFQMSGQFYNDDEFFELNRFRLSTAISETDFSFEASPVSLYNDSLAQQFKDATYRFQISNSSFATSFVNLFADKYPPFEDDLQIVLQSEGTLDEYFLDRLQANIGESSFLITARAENLFADNFSYHAQLDNVVIQPNMLDWVSENYFDHEYNLQRYQLSTIRGELDGDTEQLAANFQAETQAGAFHLDGSLSLNRPLNYNLLFEVDSLDITPFLSDTTRASVIQGDVTLEGTGTGSNARFTSSVDLSESTLLAVDLESFIADFDFDTGELEYDIDASDGEFFVSADGNYRKEGNQHVFTSDGDVQNMDINKFYPEFHANSTSFNSTFSADVEASSIDDLVGRVSFEMEQSTIDADTLRPHQFYADINQNPDNTRTFRFTSSFFDGEMQGTLTFGLIRKQFQYWNAYLRERIEQEFLFNPDYFGELETPVFSDGEDSAVDISVDMNVKDLSLFRKYYPDFPEIESEARLTASVNASPERLLITGDISDQSFRTEQIHAENFNTTFTASLRHDADLKSSSTVDLQINSSQAGFKNLNLKESSINFTMRDDSFRVHQNFERLEDDLVLESVFNGHLRADTVEVTLENFAMGTSVYKWTTQNIPKLAYTNQHSLVVDNFVLVSDTDYIEINGTYSDNFEDSVNYQIENLDLSRISGLIDGRVTFSGMLNGDFETRTLSQIPSITGNLAIEEGRMLGRVVGDVTLNSTFNSELERFDTNVHIYTDPQKYQRYYNRNDGIGQDLRLDGYFKLPNENTPPDEELFNFDADFRQIDMWIVSVIVPNIIIDMEGSATGNGYIRGNATDFDFDATFNTNDVYGVPAFTNVEYTLNGDIRFNKTDGLIFQDVQLADQHGGTGTLNGQVDLNNFAPVTDIDLILDLDDLQFMNNPYDPDIPFYGSIFGTGRAEITGTNFQPLLRTIRPLAISSNSSISIPLEPTTEYEQDHRFIRFVESFDIPYWESSLSPINGENGQEELTEELSFMERFTMDLQFQANNPINVDVIFDRVTNDMIDANGTGQMRLILDDQNVSMFGRFNIESGTYQFVSGDIFTRRFSLEEGGSISWSGDLADADLDVTAVYRARPNINTLQVTGVDAASQGPAQRVPVELVLEITGTMTSVENDFFFRMPTGIESNADPTIATQISNLNQNEDEKLIQATSILLSGNFLPPSQTQGLGLTESFSGTAVVVNPLITSQLINPLLSNQISSLLRSDVTFDIDVNLNTLNEVDLGVALRLFDDRIVLRREGQITGEQSEIGDIGATYRINQTFSLTAFHRQDPTITNTSDFETQQAQEMNGIGVEAQVQFNTWQKLRARISNAFRSLFGIETKDEEDDQSIVEN
ncbi:translocation/assembly module TamB domain-containing protein [Rhodohalobacter sp. 614A]|uniref:translocation/assembly module TamB domain-containing protein n=1 Tax=Rhodohalobacter sp. 614A TaxID=2908649 RepID=UPI001F460C57|nr:translocation/assembly module TamB [Rhodohalobacter sp. 614A]